MMRKICYLLQPEFEGLEFAVGTDRRWRVTVLIPGGRTDLPTLEYGGKAPIFMLQCSLFYNTEHEEDTTIVHMACMMKSMDDMYTLQGRESRKEIEAQGEKLQRLERELQARQRQVAEQQRRILHLQSQVHPRRRTRVTARMSVPLPQEKQRFAVEIPEKTGECV
ncbi:hypothetical protein GUJ93_ZPchr0013g35394 [Zizania palustris]|uniref:Uncharacterized protein n=1 Tax=Zizania palustris TaxID=103762 RepID=A0A8J5WUY5_ZIZPA|nr:hypothetical protein GUJ93_ZPchr0013g35394 [Zizania palustris]